MYNEAHRSLSNIMHNGISDFDDFDDFWRRTHVETNNQRTNVICYEAYIDYSYKVKVICTWQENEHTGIPERKF